MAGSIPVATGTMGYNKFKEAGSKQPDFTGSITIEKPELLKGKLMIAAWRKRSDEDDHEYVSFTIQTPYIPKPMPKDDRFDDDIPF